ATCRPAPVQAIEGPANGTSARCMALGPRRSVSPTSGPDFSLSLGCPIIPVVYIRPRTTAHDRRERIEMNAVLSLIRCRGNQPVERISLAPKPHQIVVQALVNVCIPAESEIGPNSPS